MKIRMPLERYLVKYLKVIHPEVIKIERVDFLGMLVFAHIKYRRTSGKSGILHKKSNLVDKIDVEIPFPKWVRFALFSDIEHSYEGFNRCIHDFFYKSYYEFMWQEKRLNNYEVLIGMKKKKIRDLTLDFMKVYDLSELDISIETLLRNYRRKRNAESADKSECD